MWRLDASSSMGKAPLHPSVYVAIDTDGTAYIVAHRSEMEWRAHRAAANCGG